MKTFNELTRAEQIELFEAWLDGKPVQIYLHYAGWTPIRRDYPDFEMGRHYRVAPEPDTIDWSHVAPEFKFMVRGGLDHVWLFHERPEISGGGWVSTGFGRKDCSSGGVFASYKQGTVDWKDSLVERPA